MNITPQQLPALQAETAKILAKQRAGQKPQEVEYTPWIYLRVDRCTKGNIMGLFRLMEIEMGETPIFNKGKEVSRVTSPVSEKQLMEGGLQSNVEDAVRKALNARLNRRVKK
jgi:hypothetical protein